MASLDGLVSSFAPTGSIEYHFGGGNGSGTIHFRASLTGADDSFDLLAVDAFGQDITSSLTPEQFQRAHEAVVASESNRS